MTKDRRLFPSGATGRVAFRVAVLALLVSANLAGAGASVVEGLSGALDFESAMLSGRTEAESFELAALRLGADDLLRLDGAWSLEAGEAVVNWSRLARLGVGSSLNDPNRSLTTAGPPEVTSGEDRWSEPRADARFDAQDGNLLVVARGASVEMVSGADVWVQPAYGEAWTAGRFSEESAGAGPDTGMLTTTYATTPGQPVVRASGRTDAVVRGDFTLFVWGANVTVRGPDGTGATYPSGAWYENATATEVAGPRGLTRTEYWQLLRFELVGATLRLEPREGVAQWAAGTVEATTDGLVRFEGAQGRLASATYVYDLEDEAVEVRGTVSQTVRAADGGPQALRSDLVAPAAEVSLPPSARAEAAPAAGWPTGSGPAVGILAATVLGLGFAILIVRRRRAALADDALLLRRAHQAVAQGRKRRTARLARALLRRRPEDPQAWFLHGAGLLERGAYARIVRELEALPSGLRRAPSLAWLLGLAHLLLGRRGPAARWLALAAQAPAFLAEIEASPLLEDVRRDARFQRLLGTADNPAYA